MGTGSTLGLVRQKLSTARSVTVLTGAGISADSGVPTFRGADGLWRMWYYGRDPGFDRAINLPTGRIGLATSGDGIAWQRVAGPLTMGAV